MSDYRRRWTPGGAFFFTVVTYKRRPILLHPVARTCLREAIAREQSRRPFELSAIVILADHLHALWRLPEDDGNFPARWAAIKRQFTVRWLASGGRESDVNDSRGNHREHGVWQRRFWEHAIRDQDDWNRHMNYIHYNPVKHGLASCPHAWPYSSFARCVERQLYEPDWQCVCNGHTSQAIDWADVDMTVGE